MNKQTIKDFIEWSEHLAYVDYHEGVDWYLDEDTEVIYWDKYKLPDEAGAEEYMYSSDTLYNILKKDGFLLVNTDTGGGETVTLIFDLDKENV